MAVHAFHYVEFDAYEIRFNDTSRNVKFRDVDWATVNYDTVPDDGVGGTIVFNLRLPGTRGLYSGATDHEMEALEFRENDVEQAKELIELMQKNGVEVAEEHFRDAIFKKVFVFAGG